MVSSTILPHAGNGEVNCGTDKEVKNVKKEKYGS